jgi:hypothetical protein
MNNTDKKKRGRKPKNVENTTESVEKVKTNKSKKNVETVSPSQNISSNVNTNPATITETTENNIQMEIIIEPESEEKQNEINMRIPMEGDDDYVPDFSFINECYREMIITAYKSVNRLKAWDWFRTFTPLPHEGYMFCSDAVAIHIMSVIAYDFSEVIKLSNTLQESDNHDRGSMSRTMRTLQFIATKGFDKFHEFYFSELK